MPGVYRKLIALTAELALQAAFYYGGPNSERVPQGRPLAELSAQVQGWSMEREQSVDSGTQVVLKADDLLSRVYANGSRGESADLFIAYFRSQRTGQTAHSPKNCLPGNGYEPLATGYLTVRVPGRDGPVRINRDVVARGDDKRIVLYWYQSGRRVIASEYEAKLWLTLDSIRYRRSDTALVRVVVPVGPAGDDAATRSGVDFIRGLFPLLGPLIPS
jgi:EpsI family protein